MLRFEDLVPTVTASLMWMLLASCDLGPQIPTRETNPSSLQAPYAIRPALGPVHESDRFSDPLKPARPQRPHGLGSR